MNPPFEPENLKEGRYLRYVGRRETNIKVQIMFQGVNYIIWLR
jgi:hypothetical protein